MNEKEMSKIKENLMSNEVSKQASSKIKCIDALTCIGLFTKLYGVWKSSSNHDFVSLEESMDTVYNECKNYGLAETN